eukprot:TRINITY_DN6493_c0_g1_i2.p1 TRINITY_DN6493_c0_g1~~TRINITY_DN6493_c0_g1_i2.p1  ORF type:complete len:199 (+),score=34.21 TRINITY_DN6493_c0_g1_i2:61-657(+)
MLRLRGPPDVAECQAYAAAREGLISDACKLRDQLNCRVYHAGMAPPPATLLLSGHACAGAPLRVLPREVLARVLDFALVRLDTGMFRHADGQLAAAAKTLIWIPTDATCPDSFSNFWLPLDLNDYHPVRVSSFPPISQMLVERLKERIPAIWEPVIFWDEEDGSMEYDEDDYSDCIRDNGSWCDEDLEFDDDMAGFTF